ERRDMPPWGADNSGRCGDFRAAAWLDDNEVTTLSTWAKSGAPPSRSVPATSAPAITSTLSNPTPQPVPLPISLPLPTFSAGFGERATRCFLLDPGVDRDTLLSAFDLRSEPRLAARQARLYALDTDALVRLARQRDREDKDAGWSCYGGSGVEGARL